MLLWLFPSFNKAQWAKQPPSLCQCGKNTPKPLQNHKEGGKMSARFAHAEGREPQGTSLGLPVVLRGSKYPWPLLWGAVLQVSLQSILLSLHSQCFSLVHSVGPCSRAGAITSWRAAPPSMSHRVPSTFWDPNSTCKCPPPVV